MYRLDLSSLNSVSLIKPCFGHNWKRRQTYDAIDDSEDIAHERIDDPEPAGLIVHLTNNAATITY